VGKYPTTVRKSKRTDQNVVPREEEESAGGRLDPAFQVSSVRVDTSPAFPGRAEAVLREFRTVSASTARSEQLSEDSRDPMPCVCLRARACVLVYPSNIGDTCM
jgi:hypothetical protein